MSAPLRDARRCRTGRGDSGHSMSAFPALMCRAIYMPSLCDWGGYDFRLRPVASLLERDFHFKSGTLEGIYPHPDEEIGVTTDNRVLRRDA